MSVVGYVIEMTINEGSLDEFKEKAAGYIDGVQANEPDTLVYEWYLAEDGSRALLQEMFTNTDAMLTHLGNVGESLPSLLAIAPITRFEVIGSVTDAAKEALEAFNAVHFPHMAGFTR